MIHNALGFWGLYVPNHLVAGMGMWVLGAARAQAAGFVSSWRRLWLRESILCIGSWERPLGATAARWQQDVSGFSPGRWMLILQDSSLFSCLRTSRGLLR